MTVAEMQNDIVRFILSTFDETKLAKFHKMVKADETYSSQWWDEIAEEEAEMIRISEEQIKRGEVKTWEEVKKGVDAILQSKAA